MDTYYILHKIVHGGVYVYGGVTWINYFNKYLVTFMKPKVTNDDMWSIDMSWHLKILFK